MGKIAKWKNFTKTELQEMVNQSRSLRELAVKMGYQPDSGSSMKAVKEAISYNNLDIAHFSGQGWNKDNFDYSRFKKGNAIKADHMKKALVALKGYKCERCGLSSWQEQEIPLEVHHIDGDHLNSEIDNLQLLCPNCHALTDNWRGKNNKKTDNKGEKISEEQFVEALKTHSSVRQALISLGLTGAGGNYTRAYDLINKYQIAHLIK